jgi:hypothetical protein
VFDDALVSEVHLLNAKIAQKHIEIAALYGEIAAIGPDRLCNAEWHITTHTDIARIVNAIGDWWINWMLTGAE